MHAIIKAPLSLAVALVLLGPLQAVANPLDVKPSTEAAVALVENQEAFLAPTYLFRNTADLFIRSYFADFPAAKIQGAKSRVWADQLNKFSEEMLALMLPESQSLEQYLSEELTNRLTQAELNELLAFAASNDLQAAVAHMKKLGADWKVMVKVQSVIKARAFYSESEQQQVRDAISAMRGQAEGLVSAKEEREVLLKALNAKPFQRCQAALDEIFKDSVKRLQSTPERERKFYVLLQKWNRSLQQ